MTDERIKELMGWPSDTTFEVGSREYRIRALVVTAERDIEERILPSLYDAVHGATLRALDEAGVRNEVLRGMCIEVAIEKYSECLIAYADARRIERQNIG
jgi:hypothetical protein